MTTASVEASNFIVFGVDDIKRDHLIRWPDWIGGYNRKRDFWKPMVLGFDLAAEEHKIPYKEGVLDERDIDLLLIKMVGADNDMVKSVLDDPALRKAARVLAGRKSADGPPDAKEAILAQVQRAANVLVDNLRNKTKTEREVVTAEEKVLIVRQQIDSLLAGVDKVVA